MGPVCALKGAGKLRVFETVCSHRMTQLIEYLVTRQTVGLLTMDAAVQRMNREGGRLTTSLLDEAEMDPRQLLEDVASFRGIPPATDEILARTDADLVLSWSANRARRLGAIPLRIHGSVLDVAVLEPLDGEERAVLQEEFGCEIREYLILEFRFFELLGRYFQTPVEGRFLRLATRYPLDQVSLPPIQDEEHEGDGGVFDSYDSLDSAFEQLSVDIEPVDAEDFFPSETTDEWEEDLTSPANEDMWAAVKEESGLLEIPDLRDSARATRSHTNGSQPTPGQAEPMALSGEADQPLPSERWTLEELSEFYQSATDQNQSLLATLGFMRRFFQRGMFLRYRSESLEIHCYRGFDLEEPPQDPKISVHALSGLDALRQGRDYFHGPPSQLGLDTLYEQIPTLVPRDVVVLPVTRGDSTLFLYVGDAADEEIDSRDLALAFVVRRQISDCLELLALRARREGDGTDVESEEEDRVIKRLSGGFAIPDIPYDDRGLVSLPTDGWDLPDSFDEHDTPPDSIDTRSRLTPELDDRDIARQVSEDSSWFDIEEANAIRVEEPEPGSEPFVRTFSPVAMSNEPRSDSYPSIVPGLPEMLGRQEEATASFKAVGMREPSDMFDQVPDTSEPPGFFPDDEHETLDDHNELSPEDLSMLEEAAVESANEELVEEPSAADEAEASAENYQEFLADDPSDTRELSVADAQRLVRESSGAAHLPSTKDAEEEERLAGRSETMALSPVERKKTTTAPNRLLRSGSQPRVETQQTTELPAASEAISALTANAQGSAPDDSTDQERAPTKGAVGDEETTEGSSLIDIREMQEQLEESDASRDTPDSSLQAIFDGPDEQVDEAVVELVSRPAEQLPYLANVFPGPLWIDRNAASEAAFPVYDHGPILTVMFERLPAYIEQLWVCLEQPSPDCRYYALRLLAFVRDIDLRESLLEAVFDKDNDVRRLALQLIYNQRLHLPIEQVETISLDALSSPDEHMVESAIVALTKFRCSDAIPDLVDLLDHESETIQTRARESLSRITFRSAEHDADAWHEWFIEHGDEPHELWLAQAMTCDDRDRRVIAAKYLHRLPRFAVNYHADISPRQRGIARRAVERYYGLEDDEV